jgi:hypothetical protein
MAFEIVSLVYPNNHRIHIGDLVPDKDKQFTWFVCAKKFMDSQGWHIVSVSPFVQFFSERTGETLIPQGLYKRGEGVKVDPVEAKLLILNEPHNKKRLRSEGFPLKCTSNKNVLSAECQVVTDRGHLLEAAEFAVDKYGYDGVAVKHQSCCEDKGGPLCFEATFVFRPGVLVEKSSPHACDIIRYSKQNNSKLRELNPNFPKCARIDAALKENPCYIVSKVLYNMLRSKVIHPDMHHSDVHPVVPHVDPL